MFEQVNYWSLVVSHVAVAAAVFAATHRSQIAGTKKEVLEAVAAVGDLVTSFRSEVLPPK